MDVDLEVRLAAFKWLQDQTAAYGDVLSWDLLLRGFEFRGSRVPLVSPQGIFKPRILDLPLSITTSPDSPYSDELDAGDFLHYRYRGADPNHRDNVGLRKALAERRPLVYFFGLQPGRYMAVWPVYVVHDDPAALTFTVAVDDLAAVSLQPQLVLAEPAEARRAYVTAAVRVRLHQRRFRERVIDAYRSQCAFCRLRHRELLDAAHIIPDDQPLGEPVISNGLALCKLHHAAYDSFIIGVSPDYEIRVRADVLEEEDGPVLQHGLQGLHQGRLILPHRRADWPSRDALDWRYQRFAAAG